MKRRTFLQLIGLTAAPIPPLVGADLGRALADTEAELETGETLIRVQTSIRPFHFKVPVTYELNSSGMLTCDPGQKHIEMEVLEDMRVEKVEVRIHPKLSEFYKSIGEERRWFDLPITATDCGKGTILTVSFASSGLYSIC